MESKEDSMVNIPRSIDDKYYRYNMPIMIINLSYKAKKKNTELVNLNKIADSLKIEAKYIIKYISINLNTKFGINEQGEYYLYGVYNQSILEVELDMFIDKYILCLNCKLPETEMNINKGLIYLKCQACGEISPLKNEGKFNKYLIDNPPIYVKNDLTDPFNKQFEHGFVDKLCINDF